MPRRGTLLRSDQYAKCAKRYSISSTEAKSIDLCRARMRVNAQEEKRKHGITCHTSSPLETGVPQRDFRVWLHPKRRLACPLRRLPMKPNGPRRRRRIDVPRRGTPSTQRPVCQLCKTLLHVINGSEAVGSLPHSYASKCAGRETKARYYMPYEQPLGEGAG